MQKPLIPALLVALLAFFGCTKSNDDDQSLKAPAWVVSYYFEPDFDGDKVEDTGIFAGYTFEFNADDVLIINKPDGSTITAKWIFHSVNGTPVASFGAENPTAPVDELTGDWLVVKQTDTELELTGKLDLTTSALDQGLATLNFQKQ